MTSKDNDPSWDEFTDGLDDAIKNVEKIRFKKEDLYLKLKDLPYIKLDSYYRRNKKYESHCSGFLCGKCGLYCDSSFCQSCGSKPKLYRFYRVCHNCKSIYNGEYCPDCGKHKTYKPPRKLTIKEKKRNKYGIIASFIILLIIIPTVALNINKNPIYIEFNDEILPIGELKCYDFASNRLYNWETIVEIEFDQNYSSSILISFWKTNTSTLIQTIFIKSSDTIIYNGLACDVSVYNSQFQNCSIKYDIKIWSNCLRLK